jgi:hypothetical protein
LLNSNRKAPKTKGSSYRVSRFSTWDLCGNGRFLICRTCDSIGDFSLSGSTAPVFMAHYILHKAWDSDVYTVLKDRSGYGIAHWKELEDEGILEGVEMREGRASFRMTEDALFILALVF